MPEPQQGTIPTLRMAEELLNPINEQLKRLEQQVAVNNGEIESIKASLREHNLLKPGR
jgi:hypothetical protein